MFPLGSIKINLGMPEIWYSCSNVTSSAAHNCTPVNCFGFTKSLHFYSAAFQEPPLLLASSVEMLTNSMFFP
jgi:hypothetical protein